MAVFLVVSHVRGRRSVERLKLEPVEAEHFSSQYRRRLITSTLIGLLGAIILGLNWVRTAVPFTVAMMTMLVLLVVILAMALRDLTSSRQFLQELRVHQRVRRAELEAEVDRLRQAQRTGEENGHGNKEK